MQNQTYVPAVAGLWLLGWVRLKLLRSSLAVTLRSPVKLCVIVSAWSVLLIMLYGLAYRGIRFLYEAAGIGPFLLDRIWYLFLFVVVVLLAVSQLASAYATLIRAPETHWWSSLPISSRTLSRAKWIESSFYSSWAVVLLVIPVYLAYLVVAERSLYLTGWMVVLVVPLTLIVTALASTLLLIWLRCLRGIAIRREMAAVGFVAAMGILFWMLGERTEGTSQDVWFVALQDLLPRMQVAMSPWLPSSWMAKALSAGLNNRWIEGLLYAGLLWTTALIAWRILDHASARLIFPILRGSQGSLSGRTQRRSEASGLLSVPWGMQRPFRASVLKDILLVIRDPMQWTQGVVFFGLLGAYFANIHKLSDVSVEPSWRIGIASLNLACTLLVFGSLGVRFIFPQMSLEGRSLWILRMAPNGMRKLLFAKVFLYGVLAVLIIETLLWLSVNRLDVPTEIRWWLAAVGVVAALTTVGLTVGMGALWIDPSAQDSARIVSSSNGALVLVLVLAYVGSVVGALVVAWTSWIEKSLAGFVITSLALIIVSVVMGYLPIQRGLVKLERLENLA